MESPYITERTVGIIGAASRKRGEREQRVGRRRKRELGEESNPFSQILLFPSFFPEKARQGKGGERRREGGGGEFLIRLSARQAADSPPPFITSQEREWGGALGEERRSQILIEGSDGERRKEKKGREMGYKRRGVRVLGMNFYKSGEERRAGNMRKCPFLAGYKGRFASTVPAAFRPVSA